MSESKNDEYIEISITDILCRLWRNKIIFVVVLVVTLIAGGVFLAKKNYNTYTYTANMSLPINSAGSLLVNSKSVSDVFSNKYPVDGKVLSVNNGSDAYSVNLIYSAKQPVEQVKLDTRVNKFVDFLNNSDILKRATLSYVNSLNEANQHIKLLESKLKEYQSKKPSEVVDLGVTMLEDNLITYKSQQLQAKLDLKNAQFVVNDISVDHSKASKKKCILVIVFLSLMIAFFVVLGIDFLRERFLNKTISNN